MILIAGIPTKCLWIISIVVICVWSTGVPNWSGVFKLWTDKCVFRLVINVQVRCF